MTDYGAIYAKASRENAPGIGRDNFDAGIAAVVAAAKGEALGEAAKSALAPSKLLRDASTCRQIAHDLRARADGYATDNLAAAHATDLREQSKFYAVRAMPDSEGE